MKKMLSGLFLAVVLASGFVAGRAHAAQPHMTAAITHLRNARHELEAAVADKGGHRERALAIIRDAIAEVQAGIDYGRGR